MRIVLEHGIAALLTWALALQPVFAQAPPPPPPPGAAQAQPAAGGSTYKQEELDQMLAPIAPSRTLAVMTAPPRHASPS